MVVANSVMTGGLDFMVVADLMMTGIVIKGQAQ